MKTLLILAKSSGFEPAIRAVLDAQNYRLVLMETVLKTESLLASGMIDACLVDADLTDIAPIRVVQQLRAFKPDCPIIMFAAARQWEWEEEAYLLGVRHILAKPIRGRLLQALLGRLWPSDAPPPAPFPAPARQREPAAESSRKPVQTLEALRDFSAMLTHSLRTEGAVKSVLAFVARDSRRESSRHLPAQTGRRVPECRCQRRPRSPFGLRHGAGSRAVRAF